MTFKTAAGDVFSISQDGSGYGLLTISPNGGPTLQFKFAANEMNKWIRYLEYMTQVISVVQ